MITELRSLFKRQAVRVKYGEAKFDVILSEVTRRS